MVTARILNIRGRVQGVGFRPFVFRLAHEYKLNGYVYNQPQGVVIYIEGPEQICQKFQQNLLRLAPNAAEIKEIFCNDTSIENLSDFQIRPSRNQENEITEICPDIAICPDCLKELEVDARRKGYPLINCTNCGPRFTIIEDFPYDRDKTTMREFSMCKKCLGEYTDPTNRRFHAQPTSCYSCGPRYLLHCNNNVYANTHEIIQIMASSIDNGNAFAIKGLGGYNITCDATNEKAVDELRYFKKRERKPFAVLFKDINAIKQFACMDETEEKTLLLWKRPIVILKLIENSMLAANITSGLRSIGCFLPYLPIHYLLFSKLKTHALVLTSGNESDIPILYKDDRAMETFGNISGGILTNNRKIARRADDSVVRVIDHEVRLLRRARGYVPAPIDLNFNVDGILATGAELSNSFCIGKGRQAIMSQHIGDLRNAGTYEFFEENISEFSRIYRFKANFIACDMHPNYLSTVYARETGLPVTEVQHHHAHIASVMAEQGISGPVIGVSYDGTGYGTDGNTWGSELLIADYTRFERISHFNYIPLPGGDLAIHEPWRSALAYLHASFGADWKSIDLPFYKKIDLHNAQKIISAIEKVINTPLSCSAGRLFDAVAALLAICTHSNYHAQAPMMLEDYIDTDVAGYYAFDGTYQICFNKTIHAIVKDISKKTATPIIVTKFHNTIAQVALRQIMMASENSSISRVVLSGGSFQNKYLTEKLVHLLRNESLDVYLPREIPINDGGISLGQMAIAAHKNKKDVFRDTR